MRVVNGVDVVELGGAGTTGTGGPGVKLVRLMPDTRRSRDTPLLVFWR
jgi:hypothetical protein